MTSLRSALSRACALSVGLLATAAYAQPQLTGGRWCTTGPTTVYMDPTNAGCIFGICPWEINIINSIDAWNLELVFVGSNMWLQWGGVGAPSTCDNCIIVEFANYTSQSYMTTACSANRSIGPYADVFGVVPFETESAFVGPIRDLCGPQKIVINTGLLPSATSQWALEVMMHEMGHAIGLGHDTATGELMSPTDRWSQNTSRYSGILRCLYGDLIGGNPTCGKYFMGLEPDVVDSILIFFFGTCDCSGCPSPVAASPPVVNGTPRTLVLSISENDGPYEVFATITEDELDDEGSYAQFFTTSYDSALFRVQVFEDDVQIDEAFSYLPIAIEGSSCPDIATDGGSAGVIDFIDLSLLLGCWGPVAPGCEAADLTPSDIIDFEDLAILLGAWGPCP